MHRGRWGAGGVTSGGGESRAAILAAPKAARIATVAEFEVNSPTRVTGLYGLTDDRRTDLASVRFVLQLRSEGRTHTLLDAAIAGESRGWRSFDIDVEAWSDLSATLRLITDPRGPSSADMAAWSDVVVDAASFPR